MTAVEPGLRGRRGRERRIAEEARAQSAAQSAKQTSGDSARHRMPDLSALLPLLAERGELTALVERFRRSTDGRSGQALRHVTYASIPHGAKTYLAAALVVASGERLVWIARDAEIADRVADELRAWLGSPGSVVTLEPRTALAYERSELVRDESAARVAALAAWKKPDGPRILVAGVQALFQRTLPPERLPDEPVRLRTQARISQERALRTLVELGYESVPEVSGRGEFARRGGIVDVFPAGQPLPVRIEWFGDEVETLRAFDPADQRGVGSLEETTLLPASEFSVPTDLDARLGSAARRLPEGLAGDLAHLETGVLGDAAEIWAGYLAPSTALDHLGEAIWLVDEPGDVEQSAAFLQAQADERRSELEHSGQLTKGWPSAYPEPRDWKKRQVAARTLELTWESEAEGAPVGGNPFGWREPAVPLMRTDDLPLQIGRLRAEGVRVVLASDQSARLAEVLSDAGLVIAPTNHLSAAPDRGAVVLIDRSLNTGFAGGPDELVVITDRELFGSVRVRRPRALRRVVPRDLLERLEPGDAVVHIDHGVAKYAGLVRRAAGGEGAEERDFLELRFAGSDRIWVPVEQIDRVSRYAGGEEPTLSKLGGGEWQRAKSRVRRAVGDLAKELLSAVLGSCSCPRPSVRR